MAIDRSMTAFCGAYCGNCDWKDKFNCGGCQASRGNMFWGHCDKAECCIKKGLEHCGNCSEVPCEKLSELFSDPEHGDNGARLNNLKSWAKGCYTYEPLQAPENKRL